MNASTTNKTSDKKAKYKTYAMRGLAIFAILVVFILSLELISGIFSALGKNFATQAITATANPFVGLVIGLLATAIVQSSSTTTSILVAIVSAGTIPLESAIPIIMGANIGTTVTSTIVSLGHITQKKEFRKAIAAASLHDIFNILTILLLFPLEYFTGFVSICAQTISLVVLENSVGLLPSNVFFVTSWIKHISAPLIEFGQDWPWLLLSLSVLALFFCVRATKRIINRLFIGDKQQQLENTLFETPNRSILSGFLLTNAVQSSSLTTSIIIPFVAKGKITVKQVFPFVMGANIGTTVTALIAAISKSEAAIALAIAHVLINLIGVLIFYPFPFVRNIPVYLARILGRITVKNRIYGFLYILCLFFVLPFLLIWLSQ